MEDGDRITRGGEERSPGALLTLAEVGARLGITEKAVRRRLERDGLPDLRVVRVGRSVRVDSEHLEAWICHKGEIGGARERAIRSMHISAPPYRNDPKRRQVSIIFKHPRTNKPVRKRPVTPFACDEATALEWGRKQALDLLEKLMIGESEATPRTTNTQRAKPRDPKPTPPTPPEPKPSPPVPLAEAPTSQGYTLNDVWVRFEECRARLRPGTHRVDESRWRVHIRPLLGGLPVESIKREQIARLRKGLAAYDARYTNHVLGQLRRMLEFAAEDGMLEDVPAVKSERVPRKPAEPAPDELDLELLVTAGDALTRKGRFLGTDLGLMIVLGLDAGLRPGEVAGLRWCDVDFRRKQIIIRNTRPGPGNSDLPPKAGEAGTVYLTERLYQRLLDEQARVNGRGTTYVCLNQDGKPLYTQLVSKRVAEVHTAAGLPIKRGHWLRHCAASRMIDEGASLKQTSELLRHSDLTVTQRYVHKIKGRDPGPAAATVLNKRNRRTHRAPVSHGKLRSTHGNPVATDGN